MYIHPVIVKRFTLWKAQDHKTFAVMNITTTLRFIRENNNLIKGVSNGVKNTISKNYEHK